VLKDGDVYELVTCIDAHVRSSEHLNNEVRCYEGESAFGRVTMPARHMRRALWMAQRRSSGLRTTVGGSESRGPVICLLGAISAVVGCFWFALFYLSQPAVYANPGLAAYPPAVVVTDTWVVYSP
jgi:hypothetical protein